MDLIFKARPLTYFFLQEITLWRKGDRIRKGLHLHQQPGVYQVPHAMARHNPGEFPSANIRTAPTPSEPNTPIAEPGGFSVVANNIPQQVPEEDSSKLLPEEKEVKETEKEFKDVEAPSKDVKEPEEKEEILATKKVEPAELLPDESKKVEIESTKVENDSKTVENESKTVENESKTVENDSKKDESEKPVVSNNHDDLPEKMSNLNTNDRPEPPEDDTVLDDDVEDEDSEANNAIVDNEDEEL